MRLKKFFELLFIFLLPLIILIFNFNFEKQNEYDPNNNLINSSSYIEFESPFSDYKSNYHYINYLYLNQNVKNGNFVDTNNWGTNNATLNVNNNVATVTLTAPGGPISSQGYLNQTIRVPVGHKILKTLTFKGVSGVTYRFNSEFPDTIATGEWQTLTRIVTNNYSYNYLLGFTNEQSDFQPFYLKNIMYIDLTIMFGTNYEPLTTIELEQYINLSDYIDYGTQEVLTYYSENSNISSYWQYNFTIWGRFFNFLNKDLHITDNFILRFSVSYCMLAIINIFIWNLIFYTLTLLFKIILFKRE